MTIYDLNNKRLVVATHNPGKVKEFATLLAGITTDVVSASTLGLPEPEETGTTFEENALLKARAACLSPKDVALADDSGLCVTALKGDPGLYSARWGGPQRDFARAMQRVQNEIGDAADRSAYFICVLALVWHDGHNELFEGRIHGQMVWPPRGSHGHGYDPVFMPNGYDRTFAEMGEDDKNVISHRGIATRKLLARLADA